MTNDIYTPHALTTRDWDRLASDPTIRERYPLLVGLTAAEQRNLLRDANSRAVRFDEEADPSGISCCYLLLGEWSGGPMVVYWDAKLRRTDALF